MPKAATSKLVFTGGANDRLFRAFDAGSGKVLWLRRWRFAALASALKRRAAALPMPLCVKVPVSAAVRRAMMG